MITLLSFLISESVQDYKKMQCDMIQKNNPAQDDLHTWIRKPEDIKTWDEIYKLYKEGDGDQETTPDFKDKDIEEVNKSRKITVYSSKNIKKGIFVTPSKMEAKSYAGSSQVDMKIVNVDDIAWIDILQGQYAPVSKKYLRSK